MATTDKQKDPDIERVLSKGFEEISRKINNIVIKRERRIYKELKMKPKNVDKTERIDRTEKQKDVKSSKKTQHRSSSSESSHSSLN
jgi:hypothetical protein